MSIKITQIQRPRGVGKTNNLFVAVFLGMCLTCINNAYAITCTNSASYMFGGIGQTSCSNCVSSPSQNKYITVYEAGSLYNICINFEDLYSKCVEPASYTGPTMHGHVSCMGCALAGSEFIVAYYQGQYRSFCIDGGNYATYLTADRYCGVPYCEYAGVYDEPVVNAIAIDYNKIADVSFLSFCEPELLDRRSYQNCGAYIESERRNVEVAFRCKPGYTWSQPQYSADVFVNGTQCIPEASTSRYADINYLAQAEAILNSDFPEQIKQLYIADCEMFMYDCLSTCGANVQCKTACYKSFASCVGSAKFGPIEYIVDRSRFDSMSVNSCPCMNDKDGVSRCGATTSGAYEGITSCKMSSSYIFSNSSGNWNFQPDCAYMK